MPLPPRDYFENRLRCGAPSQPLRIWYQRRAILRYTFVLQALRVINDDIGGSTPDVGDGYDPGVVICQAAAPYLAELSRSWFGRSISITRTPRWDPGDDPFAKSALDRPRHDRQALPVLRTSAGRAHLAACAPRERDVIINHLRRIDEAGDRPFLEADGLSRMIAETAQRGTRYGTKANTIPRRPRSPSRRRDEVVFGWISMIWIRGLQGHPRHSPPHDSTPLNRSLHRLLGFISGCVVAAAAVSVVGDWAWSLPQHWLLSHRGALAAGGICISPAAIPSASHP